MKFAIEATREISLSVTVEAESLEAAEKLSDELITDDFEEVGTSFAITGIYGMEMN